MLKLLQDAKEIICQCFYQKPGPLFVFLNIRPEWVSFGYKKVKSEEASLPALASGASVYVIPPDIC